MKVTEDEEENINVSLSISNPPTGKPEPTHKSFHQPLSELPRPGPLVGWGQTLSAGAQLDLARQAKLRPGQDSH
jgi:hypothetical protein